ncbi:hypothetical protein HK104_001476 [Borealophlyctis nickersoniae]|nr:hypothetical protein HK104_001476 [Borealophlyctis nickersoniae]
MVPLGKSVVKSLEIVPHDPSTNGIFIVEGGWDTERKLSGRVNITLRKALKDARLDLEFYGTSTSMLKTVGGAISTETGIIHRDKVTLIDTRNPSSGVSLDTDVRILSLPFSFPLPSRALPPTFDDGRVQIVYGLQATLSWLSMGKHVKEWDVPVQVIVPREAKQNMMANDRPVMVTNNEEPLDDNASIRSKKEDFIYEVNLQRRIITPENVLSFRMALTDLPTDNSRPSRVNVNLQCTRKYTFAHGSTNEVKEVASFTDNIPKGVPPTSSWERGFDLLVPPHAELSLESPLLTIKYLLRLLIYTDKKDPVTAIEIPLIILPMDDPNGPKNQKGVKKTNVVMVEPHDRKDSGEGEGAAAAAVSPTTTMSQVSMQMPSQSQLQRRGSAVTTASASSGSGFSGKAAPNNARSKTYQAGVNYTAQSAEEMTIYRGDIISVLDDFEDGWAFGKNTTTGQNGFVYLDYLAPVSSDEGPGNYRSSAAPSGYSRQDSDAATTGDQWPQQQPRRGGPSSISTDMSSSAKSGATYVCISAFTATRAEQLSLALGDIITVR